MAARRGGTPRTSLHLRLARLTRWRFRRGDDFRGRGPDADAVLAERVCRVETSPSPWACCRTAATTLSTCEARCSAGEITITLGSETNARQRRVRDVDHDVAAPREFADVRRASWTSACPRVRALRSHCTRWARRQRSPLGGTAARLKCVDRVGHVLFTLLGRAAWSSSRRPR